jgi:hypothetical protein
VDSGAAGIPASVLTAFQSLYQSVHVPGELGYLLGVADHDFHPRVDQLLDGRYLAVMPGQFGFDVALFHF